MTLMLTCTLSMFAQLSDSEREKLETKVKADYLHTQMEGATIYKTSKGHRVLVVSTVVTSSQNISQMNRVAQIKAARLAGEFLKGAKNKSVSVYNTESSSSETFEHEQSNVMGSSGSTIGSEVGYSTKEGENQSESESFSDSVLQEATQKAAGRGMQKLMSFRGPDEEKVFAFFMIVDKKAGK